MPLFTPSSSPRRSFYKSNNNRVLVAAVAANAAIPFTNPRSAILYLCMLSSIPLTPLLKNLFSINLKQIRRTMGRWRKKIQGCFGGLMSKMKQ